MYIIPCPKCGRYPKIRELPVNTKSGERRRAIGCPNYCSVLPVQRIVHGVDLGVDLTWILILDGSGDDNVLYRMWNERVGERNVQAVH